MRDAPPEVYRMFAGLVANLERDRLRREEAAAKADPRAHRLSRVMPGARGLAYRYYSGGRDGRGRTILFCYSTHRNVAGYFLGWRQVQGRRLVRRDRWLARRVRRRVREIAERRAAAFRASHAPVS